jgi:tetratricopeptide (TPR) repeat protein
MYHNLTAHYNVYWNGMDNLRQAVKEFNANSKDNYALVLPVYNYGDKATMGKMGQFAETSIKKASKTIQKHSMSFSGKEYVKWIDDAYMLIGKSYFYKMDYPMARRTFEFVIKTYNKNDIKYEAMLWQALANIQLGDFNRAEPMLDMVMNKIRQGQAPDKYELMTNLVYAQLSIAQKKYADASDFLNRALEIGPPKAVKTRCLFILGQIHQMNGELEQAGRYYEQVIRRNPSFDMEFNAKINLAQCYLGKGTDKDLIVKKLRRMLKDDKNKDQVDQIYYALAQIYLKDQDTAMAATYLKKSVATSKINNYQKALSALQLADIYFDRKNYPDAQAYYDSTMQFLPKDYPGYRDLKKKTEILTDLVTNLQVIQREDSLQSLAAMSESQRNQIIDRIIADILAEEQKKREEEVERQQNRDLFGQTSQQSSNLAPSAGPGAGSWYFYNPAALSNGFSNFIKKYGRRKNEDNWFLSDKTVVSFATEEAEDTSLLVPDTTGGKKIEAKTTNPKDRKYYLQDIPFSPDQVLASNNNMIQAYYNLGFIYIEGLNDYPKSIESFETLNERFPQNKYRAASCYKLYFIYKELGNDAKSDYFRNMILTQYPETDFARLLVNPDYFKEIRSKLKESGQLYEETYQAFTKQQYYMVINNCDIARLKYSADSLLMPKFEYLRALSTGKIDVQDSMVAALQRILIKYPQSDVRPLAQNILDYVRRQKGSPESGTGTDSTGFEEPVAVPYSFNAGSVHFYVLIVNNEQTDVNAQKVKISDFNTRYFDLDNLDVSSLLLDGSQEMITVNSFPDSERALVYYRIIRENKYVFTKLESTGGFSDFIISAENYPIFYKSKNIQQYQRFFKKNYPVE